MKDINTFKPQSAGITLDVSYTQNIHTMCRRPLETSHRNKKIGEGVKRVECLNNIKNG